MATVVGKMSATLPAKHPIERRCKGCKKLKDPKDLRLWWDEDFCCAACKYPAISSLKEENHEQA